jgi:hypothetical protein
MKLPEVPDQSMAVSTVNSLDWTLWSVESHVSPSCCPVNMINNAEAIEGRNFEYTW